MKFALIVTLLVAYCQSAVMSRIKTPEWQFAQGDSRGWTFHATAPVVIRHADGRGVEFRGRLATGPLRLGDHAILTSSFLDHSSIQFRNETLLTSETFVELVVEGVIPSDSTNYLGIGVLYGSQTPDGRNPVGLLVERKARTMRSQISVEQATRSAVLAKLAGRAFVEGPKWEPGRFQLRIARSTKHEGCLRIQLNGHDVLASLGTREETCGVLRTGAGPLVVAVWVRGNRGARIQSPTITRAKIVTR